MGAVTRASATSQSTAASRKSFLSCASSFFFAFSFEFDLTLTNAASHVNRSFPSSREGSGKSIREFFKGDSDFFEKPIQFVVKLGEAAGFRLEIEEYFHEHSISLVR